MFKGILGKRTSSSSDFDMLTHGESATNGKENVDPLPPPRPAKVRTVSAAFKMPAPKAKAGKERESPREEVFMEQAFDKLLDELQIPATIRPKLATMESTVKAAMLKSSQTMAQMRPPSPPATPKTLRRTRSTDSVPSPRAGADKPAPQPEAARTSLDAGASPRPPFGRGKSSSDLNAAHAVAGTGAGAAAAKKGKDTFKGSMRHFTPTAMVAVLQETSSTQLDVEMIKKLRLLLRNESASWTQEFLASGGYASLLTRLMELLEVEWREEQHDDRMLHELLRCFKALSTSEIGCFALRSSAPTPFVQLISLLYSDKKPGDVACRQVLVELLLGLFELYPPSSVPASNGSIRSRQSSSAPTLPAPHVSVFALVRALLLTPAPAPAEGPANPVSPHAFIDALHRPRIYKAFLQELSDVCRDYFWVFCHPHNTIWALSDTDERKVEKPRAPGGMTGGVEFEAMAYMTTHFRFVNALAKAAEDLDLPPGHESSAHQFHVDLFLSGFERVVLIARKASTTYYPTLHLEIARYAASAARARFELPWTVSRLVGLPPPALCKPVAPPAAPAPSRGALPPASAPSTPTKRRAGSSAPLVMASPTRRAVD